MQGPRFEFSKVQYSFINWASVSEPHTCDFNATFSLYIYMCYISICDRHCTSKIAINISIFHLGSYTRRTCIFSQLGPGGQWLRQWEGPTAPRRGNMCSLCSSGIVLHV